MFVVEAVPALDYPIWMLTHDDLMAEMISQLDAGRLRPKQVADALGIPSSRVAEMRKRSRRIQQREMPIVAELLGMSDSSPRAVPVGRTVAIRNWGKVAQGRWIDQTFDDPDGYEYVSFDMKPGDPGPDELFAVTPEGQSMNLRFPPGIQLICQRIPFSHAVWKSGDLVIAERHNHDLRELTCKRLEIGEDGVFWLHSESDQPQFSEPWRIGAPDDDLHVDNEVCVIGKVLRGVIDYRQ